MSIVLISTELKRKENVEAANIIYTDEKGKRIAEASSG